MTASQRIILNAAATYTRSLVGMVIGLFSIRWVLAALGQSDYGLYCVVGALIPFITFFNSILGVSVARYYAYSIGQAEKNGATGVNDDLKRWFNTALSIHLVVPLALILIGAPLGEYAIRHWINIPPDRIAACAWVFRIALVTTFLNMASVPFTAMYTAKQYIAVLAGFGILASVLNFCFAAMLFHVTGDKLIVYAIFMLIVNAGIPFCQIFFAVVNFPECRMKITYWRDRKRLSSVMSFAGWTLFGGGGGLLATQGNVFVTNHFFGPVLNTSYGIAGQLVAQTGTLANALMGALSPAVTTREGRGDRSGTIRMASSTGKMGALLILVFAIPLVLELPTVLNLWLKEVPPYVVPICVLVLLTNLLEKVTLGQQMAIAAAGRIACWQMTGGSFLMASVPATIVLVTCGVGPVSAAIAFLAATFGCFSSNIYFARRLLGMPILPWLRTVFVPLCVAVGLTFVVGMFPRLVLPASFLRICVTTCCTLLAFMPLAWFVVLSAVERQNILDNIIAIKRRFNPARRTS
ncbi:MAG: hypothetical protein IJL17_07495 [Kiritimatiellae bacterium]|nr:hypothetical protein [Kiritimatiellia bacterium]